MGFKVNHRKLLSQTNYNTTTPSYNQDKNETTSSSSSCLTVCLRNCKCQGYDSYPPLLPPPGGTGDDSHAKQLLTMGMIVMSCIIVGILLLGILCATIRMYYLRRNNSRRANPPIIFGTQEEFFDENHGPVLDHPIWYINTVGLSQSVIDSIAVFKYKKDVGLIEGTDCTVCLGEFQEDESLRLLPKCSHAFHISCIDTWLRSHKNCPLCRAPIIRGAAVAQASEPDSNDLDSRNEITVVNSDNYSGEGTNSVGGGTTEVRNGSDNNNGSLPVEDEHTADDSMKILRRLKTRYSDAGCRVLSDLSENWQVVEEDIQPMRRSVSLNSPAASMIYNAVAKSVIDDKHQGNSDAELGQSKRCKSKSVARSSSGISSSSICKLMKSSSIGSSLQKGPISMKRSFSSNGKFSSSRHSKRYSVAYEYERS